MYLKALRNALASRDSDKIIFLCADFNVRIHGQCPVIEQLANENRSSLIECVAHANVDSQTAKRSKRGDELIDFCSAYGLTPLNGLRHWKKISRQNLL